MNETEYFVSLVREYVATVKSCESTTPHDFLSKCARLLPPIYALGISLPDIEPIETKNTNEIVSPMSKLSSILGKFDFYYEVFDPVYDRESIQGSLSDDLADIYIDLARPLSRYNAGDVANALWEWKFCLQSHCGDHLVDSLRVIHRLIHDHMPNDYKVDAS